MEKQRIPPTESGEVVLTISGTLAEHIRFGAAASGLTPQQYVLSLLWHSVPLRQDKPHGLPDCVQLVLHDIAHYYPSRPAVDPYEECGMTQDDFCGAANEV